MTDEQIIKALDFCCGNIKNGEECTETMCYQVGLPEDRNGDTRWCRQWLIKDALDIINRQKMKVIALEDRLDWAEADYNAVDLERIKAEEELEKAKAEIERLKEDNEYLNGQYLMADMTIEKAKAEAIKEFAERLKYEGYRFMEFGSGWKISISEIDIDDLVKEMAGDN